MFASPAKQWRISALLAIGLAVGAAAAATDYQKRADGLAVYMGVMPAELLRAKAGTDHVTTMHGGLPRGTGSHHVVISIVDERTQRQLADAVVEATVGSPGLAETRRVLEPMRIGDTTTYGNYFPMSSKGPFTVRVTIRRPGENHATELQFNYVHSR